MKKILALILAAMMLLGGAAMADTEDMTEEHVGTQTDFMKTGDPATSASQSTDVWLQVEASGQIDVTVPLVVVFKTNIDGGSASTGNTYKIVNNSSAAIKVTEVSVTDTQEQFTQNGVTENMKAVETMTGAYNEYTLTMLPTDQYAGQDKVWTDAKSVVDADGDGSVTFKKESTGNVYKIASSTDAQAKGLWRIEKKDDAKDTDESYINLTLSTSKLSFVTNQKKVNDESVENGVKLFNVAYTVKIDDSTAVGGDIQDETQNHSYSYAGD